MFDIVYPNVDLIFFFIADTKRSYKIVFNALFDAFVSGNSFTYRNNDSI